MGHVHRDRLKCLYVVARNLYLFLLTCSARPCLGPAYQDLHTFLSISVYGEELWRLGIRKKLMLQSKILLIVKGHPWDSLDFFGKNFRDTSRQIFTLSLINDTVCIVHLRGYQSAFLECIS